jgi:ubiquinone/menaquinone biosynthesis C-methylase UbiE
MLKTLTPHKERVAAVYNLAAPGYDKPAIRFFPRCAARLVDLAGISPGDHVLDIATGTGVAALSAIVRVGSAGHVSGVDIAEDMLAQARRNAEVHGVANVSFHLSDGEALSFPGNSFDVVLSSSGLFFFPDMSAALREWLRVLKPGGIIAFGGFGASAFQPLSDRFAARIRPFGVPLPAEKPFSWQRLEDLTRCETLLHEVGCDVVDVREEQLGYYLDGVDDWWDIVWNSGFRGPVAQLSPDNLPRFKEEHLREVGAMRTPRGIWLDSAAVFAVGRKPRRR